MKFRCAQNIQKTECNPLAVALKEEDRLQLNERSSLASCSEDKCRLQIDDLTLLRRHLFDVIFLFLSIRLIRQNVTYIKWRERHTKEKRKANEIVDVP